MKIIACALIVAAWQSILSSSASTTVPHADVVLQWNDATLRAARESAFAGPLAARTLAIVHTCTYNAWAAYDEKAIGTQLSGALRRPASERTTANKEKAISYAAYRALVDLIPAKTDSVLKPLMIQLGYNPMDNSTDIETPAGIGNVVCGAVLESRHHDKSNQLGDLSPGPYSDWTHFRSVNMPALVPVQLPSTHPLDMNHWQPLIYVNASGTLFTQMFTSAHWCFVTPFALDSGDEFRVGLAKDNPPLSYGSQAYMEQSEELVHLSANLTDEQKMLAEYWSEVPDSPSTPLRWNELARWVSIKNHYSLDDNAKIFFVLNNALLDASIAALDLKREFSSIRPITAIPLLFNGKKIRSWGGPGKGAVEMDGSNWIPYQPASAPTPASPDYVSETSTFAATAASILRFWTGTDQFGYSISFTAGSSSIEPGITPAHDIEIKWDTLTRAVNAVGMGGRYSGIAFRQSDLAGRELGQKVAETVWSKAQSYF